MEDGGWHRDEQASSMPLVPFLSATRQRAATVRDLPVLLKVYCIIQNLGKSG